MLKTWSQQSHLVGVTNLPLVIFFTKVVTIFSLFYQNRAFMAFGRWTLEQFSLSQLLQVEQANCRKKKEGDDPRRWNWESSTLLVFFPWLILHLDFYFNILFKIFYCSSPSTVLHQAPFHPRKICSAFTHLRVRMHCGEINTWPTSKVPPPQS